MTHKLWIVAGVLVVAALGYVNWGWRGEVSEASRREIEEGSLFAARDLELAWLADPVDAYVVHVQGSARLRLPDGEILYVGYAGKTDRAYASLKTKRLGTER